MTNGYIVLTKGDSKLYQHAVEAINLGKPIYYADGNKVAFVNSIELVSTNVVIKTSDKQITVEADGTETVEDIRLKALLFNSSDLTITGATQSDQSYYTLLTTANAVKLSELPIGNYSVIQGKIKVSDHLENILYIEKDTSNSYNFQTDADAEYNFTIDDDADATVINI